MAIDVSPLLAGLNRLLEAISEPSAETPLRTVTIPRFARTEEPSRFRLLEETQIDWANAIDEAYRRVADDQEVKRAVSIVASRLPSLVRDAEYSWFGPSTTAERTFCAFCELAVRGTASTLPSPTSLDALHSRVNEAATALERFYAASRYRLVHTSAVYGVVVECGEIALADGIVLRAVSEEARHDIWSRVGLPGQALALGGTSPTVQEVARLQTVLEVTCDLAPGETEIPWSDLQRPAEPMVESLRLLGPGPVRSLAGWIALPEHPAFLVRLLPSFTTRSGLAPRASLPEEFLAVDDADRVAAVYAWHEQSGVWPEKERQVYEVARRRFSQTYERIQDEDRLIDAWIAFESMFLPDRPEGLSYPAQMRIARFVGGSVEEREALRDQLKASYRMRGSVVHGSLPTKRKPEDVAARTEETLDILRRALVLWLDPQTKRSEEALDRALLS